MTQLDMFAYIEERAAHKAARDRALDQLERTRSELVAIAHRIALEVYEREGQVTSTEVLRVLKERYSEEILQGVDKRFMGAVFRRGWVRMGWTPSGSHCRPVSIWRLRA